jgi:citrate lyase subunit beta/citryl-CoA lyase
MLLRSYLFAPGNNEKLLARVFEAGADAVVLDLEDAVPEPEKPRARELVRRALEARPAGARPAVFVRLNEPGGRLWADDLTAVVTPALTGIRLPKVESAAAVGHVADALARAERQAGLANGSIEIACTLETARGVHQASAIATAPRVRNLAFGGADFAHDLGLEPGDDEQETLFARSQLVLAARVAGIDPPIATVWTRLDDADGLRASSERARRLGFFGRSCIHPRQLAVIHEVFSPRLEALAWAREVVEAFERAAAGGSGAVTTTSGQFVDAAVARRARALLALAESLDVPAGQEAG